MSNEIVCFGEALIDFLNTGKEQHGEQGLNQFVQFPGGAPANVAVAAAKLGGNVKFVGQVGDDPFGEFLVGSLAHYGVNTEFTFKHPTAKTPLAFVFLDAEGDRSFSFFRDNTADLRITEQQLIAEIFQNCQVFHFCSNTLTGPDIQQVTQTAISKAKASEAIVSFDVNIRHNLWADNQADQAILNDFVYLSDVVKFSREEFDFLAGSSPQDYLAKYFDAGVKLVLITNGCQPVSVITQTAEFEVAIPITKVVDTTAGGDAFSGAIVYALHKTDFYELLLNPSKLERVVTFAVSCGAFAVARQGAFPALPTPNDINLNGVF